MAIDLIKQTLKYTIFLGLIGIFVAWAFGLSNSFSTEQVVNGQKILVFSWSKYLENLNNSWIANALNFEDILPSRTWQEANFDFWSQEEFWGAIINDLALIFDWMYFPINFVLWLLRWVAWVLRLGLALIGWDFTHHFVFNPNTITYDAVYDSMLIQILSWIVDNLMIPYI